MEIQEIFDLFPSIKLLLIANRNTNTAIRTESCETDNLQVVAVEITSACWLWGKRTFLACLKGMHYRFRMRKTFRKGRKDNLLSQLWNTTLFHKLASVYKQSTDESTKSFTVYIVAFEQLWMLICESHRNDEHAFLFTSSMHFEWYLNLVKSLNLS